MSDQTESTETTAEAVRARLARAFLTGALAGWLLSLARAPLGAALTTVPAVGAVEAATYRGLALAVVGLALARARVLAGGVGRGEGDGADEGTRPLGAAAAWLCFGVLAGFALHGLWLVRLVELGGPAGLVLWLGIAALAMLAAAAGGRGPGPATGGVGRPGALECLGLALAGGGVAIALEGVARPLRLLGTASPHDDTLFALTLLATVAVGAVAFGPLLAGRGRPVLAAGLALAALAALASAHLLADLSTRNGLDGFLRSPPWSLDLAWLGRLAGGALIGARTFLVPGFVLGAAVFGARHRLQLASTLVGAGLGLVILNALLVDGAPAELRALSFRCAERVALGSLCAGLGGLLALIAARPAAGAGRGKLAAAIGTLACLAALVVPRLADRPQVLPLSPWETFAPDVVWSADTPEGLLTVESSRGGERVVTLDRRLLTPTGPEARADENRLETSWLALPEGRRADVSVLLVGQLTPLRAWVLRRLGAASVDRTAAWHRSMPAIEEVLFGAAPASRDGGGFEGRVLTPGEALDRLAGGAYDLAIVPPAEPRGMRAPRGASDRAPAVVWLYADGDLVGRDLGERALLSSDGVDHLAVGVHRGLGAGTLGLPTGRSRLGRWPLLLLHSWPFDRSREALLELGRRLEAAGRGTPDEDLLAGLRMHLEVQKRSSPWENLARATETDPEALARLREAMVSARPGSPQELFLRRIWSGLAATLVEKRELVSIETHLAPLAERFAPWIELERALAHADLEMLEPEAAAGHLRVVVAGAPLDLAAHMALGHALEMAGDAPGAVAEYRRALEIQPGRRDVRRRLAMALVRSGDPEGGALVDELLAEDPDDEELERFRGLGPFPPLEVRFVPFSDEHLGRKQSDPEADEHGEHGEHAGHEH